MKKVVFGLSVLGMVSSSCVAGDGSSSDYYWEPPTGIARGVVNILTSPVEIVRDVSLFASRAYVDHPDLGGVDGAVFGVIPGAIMCAGRIIDGVADCFTLGISGNTTHGDFFPTFAWEDLWTVEELR